MAIRAERTERMRVEREAEKAAKPVEREQCGVHDSEAMET